VGAIEGAPWTLHAAAGRWRLEPLGIDVEPPGLGREQAEVLAEVVRFADRAPAVTMERADGELADGQHGGFDETDWTILVRVLGTVDVVDRGGRAAELERSKSLELITWLAEHRRSATRSAARAALWETEVRDATFANVVSDARRGLARLVTPPPGEEWLGRTLTEHLPLHAAVVTDATLLERRVAAARRIDDPRRAIEVLRPGLELVRDVPFAGTAFLWPDSEGWVSHLMLLVTSAAAELARRSLEVGDADGVFWATGRGLAVVPGHEELIALRMRAHAATGDLAAVRSEWQSYERVLDADTWGDGEPSPKLASLRRELLGHGISVPRDLRVPASAVSER
jgi:two-component SAPR family response regulator